MCEIRDTSAINPLLNQLSNPYVTVRASILKSLANFDTLLYPYIEERLEDDFSPELLLLGAEALTSDSSNYRRKFKRLLFNFLENCDWKIREYSARGLAILTGEDVKERFKLKLGSEPNHIVRGVIKFYLERKKK